MSLFGKAKFGGNKREWWKLKDGQATFRILPPMGDLGEDGRWSVYYKIHYGYKNSDDKMRTFESPEVRNRKTKMIDVRDAALDRINDLKAKLKEAQDAKNEQLSQKLLTLVGGKKSRYNLDANHYMNVVDLQGNVGILKIRHRAKLALDAIIKELRDRGIDPLSEENGRYFTFSRSGSGMDTVYQVSVYKKRITVAGVGEVEQDVVHQIDEELARRLLVQNKDGSYTYKEAGRLDTLFPKPTAEEVARIVAEGATAVDEILDSKPESQDTDDSGLEEDEAPAPVRVNAATTASLDLALEHAASAEAGRLAQAALAATVTSAPTPAPAATQAAPAPAPVKVAPPVAPQTTAQVVSSQSDEDFLKGLGL